MIPVERKGYVCGGILVVVIFVLAAANLLLGSVDIPAGAVWGALTGGTVENEAWSFIVSGIPRAFVRDGLVLWGRLGRLGPDVADGVQ